MLNFFIRVFVKVIVQVISNLALVLLRKAFV